jgi:hypothetical protein
MNHLVLIAGLLLLAVSSGATLAIRRIFYHPLSKFPGPWLAALTPLYKTYYEVFRGGELLRRIQELHNMHGERPLPNLPNT